MAQVAQAKDAGRRGYRLKPLPGHLFVKPESDIADKYYSLVIPDSVKHRAMFRGKMGRVIAATPYVDGQTYSIWCRNGKRATVVDASKQNRDMLESVGKRCIVYTGVLFMRGDEPLLVVRWEHVEAVLDDDANVQAVDNATVGRCSRCKSATGEANMLLDNHGYCVQCGLNAAGQHVSKREIK